jgi:hypothetical protein
MPLVFRIPTQSLGGLSKLFSLSKDQREQILIAIERVPVGRFPNASLGEAFSTDSSLTNADLNAILDSIDGLLYAKRDPYSTNEEFAALVTETYVEQVEEEVDEKKIMEFLIALFNRAGNYRLTLKANELLYAREQTLTSTKIVSDLRPVFDDEGKTIRGSIIMHTLSISYRRDGAKRKILLAVDDEDLDALQLQITRAKNKSEAISTAVTQSSLKTITFMRDE